MPRSVAVGIAVAAAGLVALVAVPVVMMAFMMGGRGSNPAGETPVQDVTAVRIEDFAFAPANIVVDVGTTVTWTNFDNVGHTVTSDSGEVLDSPLLGRGETFSVTFEAPGEYAYHCDPHPNMRGLVTVRAVDR